MRMGGRWPTIVFGFLLYLSALGASSGEGILSFSPLRLLVSAPRSLGFVSVSESHYDHTHHTHHDHRHEVPEPHLDVTNASTEVYLGSPATLDCTVHDLTNESVSWMKQEGDSITLLTWDNYTYVQDDRYRLVADEGEGWRRWRLVISGTEGSDAGQYRCQVATTPPLVLHAALTVIEPRAKLVEERGGSAVEKHYNSGSMIELQCIIDQVPFPHKPVTWRRGNTVLAFNTSRGGISVKRDEKGGRIASRLYVANASPKDSGQYSCWYHNYTSATITVHVIAGENSAGLQHDALPGSAGAMLTLPAPHLCLISLTVCLTIYLSTSITDNTHLCLKSDSTS